MNRWQKIARFNLIVIAISLTLSGTAFGVLAFKFGLPKGFAGLGFLGICGIMGFTPLIYKKDKVKVAFDERDELIQKRANLIAYSTFWVVFVAACMIPWFVLGDKGAIPVKILPLMVVGGLIVIMLVQSVATLVQYGWRDKGEKS